MQATRTGNIAAQTAVKFSSSWSAWVIMPLPSVQHHDVEFKPMRLEENIAAMLRCHDRFSITVDERSDFPAVIEFPDSDVAALLKGFEGVVFGDHVISFP